MSGTFDDPWQIRSLDGHKEVATEYGLYMADFAVLQAEFYFLFSSMLGRDSPGFGNAQSILGHIQSFALKLKTIENYIPYSHLKGAPEDDLRSLIQVTRECNKFRNSMAHGLFCLSGGELHLAPYAFETARNPKPIPITGAKIAERRISDLQRAITMLKIISLGEALPDGFRREPSLVRP